MFFLRKVKTTFLIPLDLNAKEEVQVAEIFESKIWPQVFQESCYCFIRWTSDNDVSNINKHEDNSVGFVVNK